MPESSELDGARLGVLEELSRETQQALLSLIEALEAVDWYAQRVEASKEAALEEALGDRLAEEMEQARGMLERIRWNDPAFGEQLRRVLFRNEAHVSPSPSRRAEPRQAELPGISSLREQASSRRVDSRP